ncbi:phosphate propanoyltransferase [Clostridium botulinum C]|uniref:phosphate propanoyltransferase n=1 Tax=Clostridium botulinum TaxID=1491 RepID=UPI001E29AC5E|nr:phosphate propanoyltransferase [Clostridium botulinum]MCD3216250.1 phosphate propanoyltransferase [Clostridium botulinum C]MCD3245490.1 phosphate propanoyltransferase [Clostridium botulinum C]MCD3261869.1 phosphate propanoyltransferase [Clostridium botulinum C]
MNSCEEVLKLLLEFIKESKSSNSKKSSLEIPVGISNRHVHLSQKDLYTLFGNNYRLVKIKDLSQPGQFASKETVTICGPKGAIEKVRILGPARSKTQVEVLNGDCIKLGVSQHVRLSGNTTKTSGITIIGPKGSVQIEEGVIVAQRHIHMTPEDAKTFGVHDGDIVSINLDTLRGGIYNNVIIRANDTSKLECHIDIEEANAMGINPKSKITIVS